MGRPHGTGRFETLEADTVILAIGQASDTAFLHGIPGHRVPRRRHRSGRQATLMTGAPGIFAGGDAVPSQRTVTVGTGHGKRPRAPSMRWPRGGRYERPPKHDRELRQAQPLVLRPARPARADRNRPGVAGADFDEVLSGLTSTEASFEAGRCLSCGNCFECDGCLGACPEDAVIKLGLGNRYEFNYGKCTGCSACYRQCPVHAIEMIAEV